MDRKDFLLLVVASAKGESLTPVQLQKALFLIGKSGLPETPDPFYSFEPYHYGPFDRAIYEDAEAYHLRGMMVRAPAERGGWMDTMITPNGLKEASELKKELSSIMHEFIQAIVDWVRGQSFRSLVSAIYRGYPEYSENSVFRG